jgi:Flp pilus assembly protein TadG
MSRGSSAGPTVTLFAQFQFRVRRFRRDRQGAALLGWALIGALISGLVAWSVDLAERESRAHAIAQAAW